MFGFIGSVAGAIESIGDFANNVAEWMRQKERDALVRKAESADDKQEILDRHKDARRARARNNGGVQSDPANRDSD